MLVQLPVQKPFESFVKAMPTMASGKSSSQSVACQLRCNSLVQVGNKGSASAVEPSYDLIMFHCFNQIATQTP